MWLRKEQILDRTLSLFKSCHTNCCWMIYSVVSQSYSVVLLTALSGVFRVLLFPCCCTAGTKLHGLWFWIQSVAVPACSCSNFLIFHRTGGFFLNYHSPFFLTLLLWFNQRFPMITLVTSAALTTVRLLNLLCLRKVLRVLTWLTLQTPPMPSSAERSELPLCQPPRHSDHNRPPVGALRHRCYLALWHPLCLGKETIKMSLTEN